MTLGNFNQPVTVQAPASTKPITQLMQDIQSNPQLLGPLGTILGGLTGGMGGLGTDETGAGETTSTETSTS